MNGNIFNYSLALEQYNWKCNCGLLGCSTCSAYATPPMPPGIVFCPLTGECEPLFAQSYINAYNTAFNQSNRNYQKALNRYQDFDPSNINSNFIPGTFGSREEYIGSISNQQSNIIIKHLQDDLNVYVLNTIISLKAYVRNPHLLKELNTLNTR